MRKLSRGTKQALAVGAAVLVVATGLYLYDFAMFMKMRHAYGDSPGFQSATEAQPDGTFCERINSAYPKAHYNWRGEVWQDEHLYWEDIRIDHLSGPTREENGRWKPSETVVIPHNHTGPMTRGDRVCGLERAGTYEWVYIPEEKVIFTHYP